MKNIFLYIGGTLLVASTIVMSCKKSNSTSSATTRSLKQLFSNLNYAPQGFIVAAGRDTIIYGADSTMLHFYTNSFKDGNGNAILSGNINVLLVEMYKPGDMICNGTTTITSGDSLLTSGGEINVTATKDGLKVYANSYGVGFKQHGPSSQPMSLYYGGYSSADSVATWTQADATKPGVTALGSFLDTVHPLTMFLYIFDSCHNFSLVNCDNLQQYNGKVPIKIILSGGTFNLTNTGIFFIFPANNVVFNVDYDYGSSYDQATNTFSLQAPIGINYELVAITNINGSFYFFENSGIITNNMSINVVPERETQGDVVARMQGL